MREEFESLPEIAEHLEGATWSDATQRYVAKYVNHYRSAMFLNGAWCAYQEQQKKIEQLLDIINTGLEIERNMNNQIHSLKEKIDKAIEYLDSIEGLVWYEQIKELLK